MKIYAFDPGKTTGWAHWNTTDSGPRPREFGEIKKEDLSDFLNRIRPEEMIDYFVIEDYKIRNTKQTGGFNHQWDNGLTLRVIGSMELRADQIGAKVVLQQPSIKPVGAGFGGIPHVSGKHDKHYLDAMKHGFYFLVRNKEIEPLGKIR